MKKIVFLPILLLLSSTLFAKNFYQSKPQSRSYFAFYGGGGFSISKIESDEKEEKSDSFWLDEDSKAIGTSYDFLFGVAAYFFYEEIVLSVKIEREYRKFSNLKYDDDDDEVSLKNSFTSLSLGIGSSYYSNNVIYLFSIGAQYSIASNDTVTVNFMSGHSEVLKSQDLYSIFFETAVFASPIYSAIELKINLNTPYKANSASYDVPNMIETLFSFKIGVSF